MVERPYTRTTSSIRPLPWLAAMLVGMALSLLTGGFAAHAQTFAVSPGTIFPPAACYTTKPNSLTPVPTPSSAATPATQITDVATVPIEDTQARTLGYVDLFACNGRYYGIVGTADMKAHPLSASISDGAAYTPATTTISASRVYTQAGITTDDTQQVCVIGTILGFSNYACTDTLSRQEGKPF